MAPNSQLRERLGGNAATDPREGEGAQVIDLATRNVMPRVSQRKRGDGLGLAAGVLVVAALGGLTLWSMDSVRGGKGQGDEAAPRPARNVVSPAVAPSPAVTPQEQPRPAPTPLPVPAPAPVLASPPGLQTGAAPQANRFASPTLVFDGAASAPAPSLATSPLGEAKPGGNGNDDFAARIGGVGTTASATRNFDPSTTVTQGTLIPAVLETAIDTDVPGYVRAIVSSDVRSFDGKHVLVPRSSRLIGQYKSGMATGQKRAYVIWSRLIRPDGVSVDIGSPAISFGGETGLAGKVDSHFFQRFGSALLLSVVSGLSTIASSGSGLVIASGGQSAASTALQQNGQISPTIRVRMGEPIRVFAAKDWDFSKVQ